MVIRPAVLADIEALQLLYQKQFADLQRHQPYSFKADLPALCFLQETIEQADCEFILAVDQGKLVGMAALFIEQTLPYECFVSHRYLNFADLYVEVDYRNQGLGKQLIQAVKEWAKQKEVDYIELLVLKQNNQALQLYLEQAFEIVHTTLRYRLD
ncbi:MULTISPECIES: GNAT family N-acetyltransferase [Myroides]|uniref:GNAT family N-acetyltransferase n=1 Tax=Myroides odoratus TaxID=256 RepID=UPI0024BF2C8D|nr:GNAT family N-acetyltransferase [Myroides sp. mNGS23_01]WHT39197.1 GNAT family N-acetyltransferase [Myroides sp. mNGS23_01]